jgi:hypothetical protein
MRLHVGHINYLRRSPCLEEKRRPLGTRIDDVSALQMVELSLMLDGADSVRISVDIVLDVFDDGVLGPGAFPQSG